MVLVVVVEGKQVRFPHHTSVCKIVRLCGALSSLPLEVSPLDLVSFLILRRSFQRGVNGYSFTGQNLRKTVKGSILLLDS